MSLQKRYDLIYVLWHHWLDMWQPLIRHDVWSLHLWLSAGDHWEEEPLSDKCWSPRSHSHPQPWSPVSIMTTLSNGISWGGQYIIPEFKLTAFRTHHLLFCALPALNHHWRQQVWPFIHRSSTSVPQGFSWSTEELFGPWSASKSTLSGAWTDICWPAAISKSSRLFQCSAFSGDRTTWTAQVLSKNVPALPQEHAIALLARLRENHMHASSLTGW